MSSSPSHLPSWLRAAALAVCVLVAAGVGASSARAAVPITDVFAGPITAASPCRSDGAGAVLSTQAGSRPDFCVAFAVDSPPPAGDDLQRMVVDTPLGFAGDPTGRPICTAEDFREDEVDSATCPAGSQVGTASVDLRLLVTSSPLSLFGVPGQAFNLAPEPSEVARIGVVLDPPGNIPQVKLVVRVTLRPAPNVGLRSTIEDIPAEICLVTPEARCNYPIALDRFALRFWGSNVDHPTMPSPFALLGADCTNDQVTTLRATSYDGTPTEGEDRYRLTDCETAPFGPALSITDLDARPDVPTAATVRTTFLAQAGGRFAAPPQRAVVTLPDGLMLGAQVASGPGGLPVCTPAAFAQTSSEAAACPAASGVGDVRILSPVLDRPLTGRAFIGAQPAVGALPQLYVEAQLGDAENAPRVKLIGTLSIAGDGRLVTVLDDLPQVPVSEFTLTFRGGPNAPLVTPPTCRTAGGAMVATPRGGGPAITAPTEIVISEDCGAVGGFAPRVGFDADDRGAGLTTPFTTVIERDDRTQRLASTVIDLPPGQVANLTGVPECPQADAARGACDPSTRIGTIAAQAGVGPAPFSIGGAVYLVAREEGAVAGIAIVTRVLLGEVDLGTLAVPGRIEIRPDDLGLRIRASVPERFQGLPLDLRSLVVRLDRPGFARSPTSCEPLASTSSFTGTGGATASAAATYQLVGCGRLSFAPQLLAAVTGDTKSGGRPNLSVQINNADGASALRSAAVTLPAGIAFDLQQVPRACPQDTFRAGGCPETSRIGRASGRLAITDEPLSGWVYLLRPAPGTVLPGLGLDFVGRFAGRVVGSNAVDSRSGRLISRFPSIPDLPLTSLQIDVAGGTGGALVATNELCAQPVGFEARLDGQSGGRVDRSVRSVCNAPLGTRVTAISGRVSGLRTGRPVLRLRGTDEGRRIRRVDLTLPAGWALASQRGVRPSRYAKVSGLSVRASASLTRRSPRRLRVTMPRAGSTKFNLLTRTGSISVRRTTDRRTRQPLLLTARITYDDGSRLVVPVRLTPR